MHDLVDFVSREAEQCGRFVAVSYTHLDVYKRQHLFLDDDEAVNLKKVLAFDIPALMQMTPSQPKTPLTNILKNV